jgi:hypothetical protein
MDASPKLRVLADRRDALIQLKKDMESPSGKRTIDRLRVRMAHLQSAYIGINTTTHTNVVVAELSEMQGKETQCRELLESYLHVDDHIEKVDAAIEREYREVNKKTLPSR